MSSSQYTAFISYRHQTPDQEIAKKLHQMIETYTVPAALRQEGERHPGKVFRDQEELPLSADLGRDIEAALENSDWLICICSPRYLQSKWCLRELEYFIEHKGRDRVLAVLVEGEPEDSFPELLRFETDENGNRKEREPLAANVRGESLADNLKKLKKEKYRILAPIVGTTFDGLYQRARRRTMRNIMAAALASVVILGGFLAYALVQNGKITAQNEQITAQNERISAQNDELTEKNEQIEKANQDLTKANDEITAKNKEISDKNDELTEKNEQIEKANQELTEKNEQIEKANEDLSKANDEITAKNKEISDKNDELTEKNEQIEKANQELTEKNEQIEKANQELTEKNEQIEKANEDLSKANDEITAKNKEISEKNEELTEKNEQIEKANQDLTKANDEITAKNKEISEKNEELTEKNEQIEKANQDLTEANEQITAQNKEISEKNIQIEEERATAARNESDLLTEKSIYYSSINRKNEATKLALDALDVSETVDGYGKSEIMEALAVSCYMGDFAVDAVLDFPGFVNYSPSCIFSPDGKKIAVVDSRSGLSLCDAVTGERLWVSTPFSHDITAVHWNADSTKLVVTVMYGHMVCIIDAGTGEHLKEMYKAFLWPCNAIFEGDDVIVAFSKGMVRWKTDSEEGTFPWPIQIDEDQHISSRSFQNDRYISLCQQVAMPTRIYIQGLHTDEYFCMVMDNNTSVTGYTISPDAEWIYVHQFKEAMVINMRTDEIRWRVEREAPGLGADICSPVWVGDLILDCGNAYDAMTGEVRYTMENDCVCVSPDGQFFADATAVYRLSDGKAIADVPGNGSIKAMSPDGSRLIVYQPTVYGRGLPNNEDAIAARRQEAYVELFPGNGSQYIVDQYAGSILEIPDYTEPDLPPGTFINLYDPYGTQTTSYLMSRSFLSPDGRYYLMSNMGAYIPLYDLQAGDEPHQPIARMYDFSIGDHVECKDISFSADSRLMAIAGAAGHVAVYELATGRMIFSFTDMYLARSLSEIRFNASGNYMMVADFNCSRFRVYSTTNGQTVYNMNATKEVQDWGFDRDTGDAVMWYTDGSAQIYRMFEDENDLLAFAREKTAE